MADTPPLKAADLISPEGEIQLDFFPGRSRDAVESDVTAWLKEAYAKSVVSQLTAGEKRDGAAAAWVYFRCASTIYRRLGALPSSVTVPAGGSHSYTNEQMKAFKEWMTDKLNLFNELTAEAATVAPKGLPNPIWTPTVIVPR